MSHEDCQLLFEAGTTLVEKSGLVRYCDHHFIACDSETAFDEYWEISLHQDFGRYMAWVLFSVGAENLAKAACVCNKVVKVKSKTTLEQYVNSHFRCLSKKGVLHGQDNEDRLFKGYELLKKVRNRDAHAFRKGVRSADFPSVKQYFVPALNVLVMSMRGCGSPIP